MHVLMLDLAFELIKFCIVYNQNLKINICYLDITMVKFCNSPFVLFLIEKKTFELKSSKLL